MIRALGLVKRDALSKTERSAAGTQSFRHEIQVLIMTPESDLAIRGMLSEH